ncbi:protein-glutamate O-methyltransferase CheR [Geotalea sp. SG265]|uniref:CheR family methyltransferase n=1 Tax=Geotalea sp. SG265 TaxID=2922867 RepID=UPI001FB03A4A|nr:protein-glutamate O-methyltransferase CheR [Geotalea sp. SG265]
MNLAEDIPFDISPESFGTISRVLKSLKGFNLSCYKDKCIKRRIGIRVRATHCASVEEYCDLLLDSETELELLYKVLTIHVSQFFRNPLIFRKLREEIIPQLIRQCRERDDRELRLWSVGCASGEEPYSLALILREFFSDELHDLKVSILATDVDTGTLQAARTGIYGEDRMAEVSDFLRMRYFTAAGSRYQLRPEVKEMVTFRQSDLFDTVAYPASDLILCRNVLIYFERAQQQKIMKGFADVLEQGGFLVLGKSETLSGPSRELFKTVCATERIYRAI